MNGNHQSDGSLKSFYGYKETFGEGVTWVSIPKDLTFVHTNNPYEDEDGEEIGDTNMLGQHSFSDAVDASEFRLSQDAYPAYATHGLEALSAVASQDQYNYAPSAPMSQHDPMATHASQNAASPPHRQATPSQNLDFILNPSSSVSAAEGNLDPQLHSHASSTQAAAAQSLTHVRTQSSAIIGARASLPSKGHYRRTVIEEPLAFLLRDFSERAAVWMDLFDLSLFFAARVPILAMTCPLLLYACASLSAKRLARAHGREPMIAGKTSPSRRITMEDWSGSQQNTDDWVRTGHEYYDIAISLLRQTLTGASQPPTPSFPDPATQETSSITEQTPLPTADSVELVAAAAILCVYELLDAPGLDWNRHLDGTKSLFDIARDRMVSLASPPSPNSTAPQITNESSMRLRGNHDLPTQQVSPSLRAVFWNVARQDMLSAFINHTFTQLDTSDLPMWVSAGIRLNADGHIYPSNPEHANYNASEAMNDDMISNALVWLIMKLVNYIAAGDELPSALSPMGFGVRQQALLSYWEGLEEEFRIWYEGLPDGFHATGTHAHRRGVNVSEKVTISAMQFWHFANIQLVLNKPHLTTANSAPQFVFGASAPGTSLATRHASYASILQRSRIHAKEIVTIGLGRSDEATRIHSVQPLWTAGLVLGNDHLPSEDGKVSGETETWRRTIVDSLRGIERDTGWACEYRVQSLLELWGLPLDWPAKSMSAGE